MSVARDVSAKSPLTWDYERDPRFLEYLRGRLEAAIAAKESGHLTDAKDVFAAIRRKHGWDSGR
jgi:hypothetical protein